LRLFFRMLFFFQAEDDIRVFHVTGVQTCALPIYAWKKAYGYAYEIAADYSHPVVRSASFLLTFVWNRIYRGVLVHHLDRLKQAAPGHEVVYVPSHRSHMDYLLLSYLLYTRGIVPPHIVAGINLNLPVIGTLLRKGGAFFIR